LIKTTHYDFQSDDLPVTLQGWTVIITQEKDHTTIHIATNGGFSERISCKLNDLKTLINRADAILGIAEKS